MERPAVVETLRAAVGKHWPNLQASKDQAEVFGSHGGWPWNGMILSAATRGGSKRWAQVVAQYDSKFAWDRIQGLSDEDRRDRLLKVGRFKNKTADWLESVFSHIKSNGGPAALRRRLSSMSGHEVIAFWCSFPGMGDKYAGNIMMDIYDPRFRNGFFAIDSRISSLLKPLGYAGPAKYASQEPFLNELSAGVGVDSWDLDRLLYQRAADIEMLLAEA